MCLLRIANPKTVLGLVLLLACSFAAQAQLKANFTADVTSGCSPLTVAFSNTTTGASPSAKYQWSMGNGNTSEATNAQAVYTEAKTYTITLTVKDGNQTDTKSTTITVYKKPVVNFTADPVKACAPSEITFTSTSTAGDGTISNYFWDFGDGTTSPGPTLQSVKHRYTFAQKPPVKLTVTNSHGCYATAEKSGLVEITQGLRINFAANKTALCALPDAVSFTNTTTGPGTLSYQWSFGDGTTSTEKAPTAVTYTKKGLYSVKLIVTNGEGCTDSVVRTDYINAANFESKFDLPAPLCSQRYLNFTNTSKPVPTQSLWKFSDDNSSSIGNNVSHYYQRSGNFQVQLINTFGTCQDTATKSINIGSTPALSGFVTDKNGACKTPLTVAFEDTSANAERWHWNFGTGVTADTSNKQKASFTFTQFKNHNVTLTVTNASGCQASISRHINVSRPNVTIGYTRSNSTYGLHGCPGLQIKFKSFPENEVTEYRWDFGDGTTSTQAEPEHEFKEVGKYTVKLFYKTAGGCEDSVIAHNYVNTYRKPKPDFESLSGLTICGSTPVRFKDLTDTATSWYWTFGDGGTSTVKNPTHAYGAEGNFTVTLVATNRYCSDTARKPQFIKLTPPFPNITGISKSCAEKGKVTFRQSTQGATKWEWDFGDGSTSVIYTTNKEEVTHTYTKSGVYKVFLYASNSTCTTYDTTYVSVMLKQKPVITTDKNILCGSDTISLTVAGMDTIRYYYPPNKQTYPYPYSGRFVYSNGTVHSYTNTTWYPPQYTQRLTNFKPGTDSIRLITYDGINGCYDTSNFVTLKISGPVAGFSTTNKVYCAGTDITFTDTSKATGNAAIKQWIWDFGDGTKDTLTTSSTVTHKYRDANYFYPRLKVVDENGCFSETPRFGVNVTVYGPVANFYAIDTVVQPNTSVQFYNTTNNWPFYPVTYSWDFGDGSSRSSAISPAHVYTKSGTYTVKLFARSSFGCTDSLVRKAYIIVKAVRAQFQTIASYVNNNSCPPLLARFTSNSINADSLFWDFGDQSYADNVRTPSHTYYQPGVYKVKLYAFGLDAVDSTEQEVMVNGPYGTITPNVLKGCSPTEVTLTAVAKNAVSFTWDFNDGHVFQGKDTAASHAYTKAGVYMPKVILRDASGCTATFLLQDSIIIDRLSTSFKPSLNQVCDSALVSFSTNPVNFGADSLKQPLRYQWSFGTGNSSDTSDQQNPGFNFNRLGKYTVRLTTTSAFGCTETVTDTISVLPKPKAEIKAAAAACIGQMIGVQDAAAHIEGESWRWQFGDGTTSAKEQPDSLAFDKPGRYQFALYKNSTNGCADTALHELIVDKLSMATSLSSKLLCDSGTVQFQPKLESYAFDSLGIPLNYHWNFGTGSAKDTSDLAKPNFTYTKPSKNKINLTVASVFGCTGTATDSVVVLKTPRGSIISENAVCVGSPIMFRGQATEEDQLQWQWDLAIGRSTAQAPLAQTYTTAGKYNISLVVFNNPACKDTTVKELIVNRLPQIGLSTNDTSICRSESITLTAHDGEQYAWSALDGSAVAQTASITQTPLLNTAYKVQVTNSFGCVARDSVRVSVSQPFNVKAAAAKNVICATDVVQLQSSGAVRYKWTPADMSNPEIPNPVAQPMSTTTYTVVGYGADHCFTDTARVRVEVIPLPTVNAGADTTVLWGREVPLLAQTSTDVSRILWTPSSYLSCVTCKTPVSTPQKPIEYTVTVRNSFGCTATDTVRISLECSQSTVHIPNAFTPNADGLNDVFYIKGGGISTIKYLKIFNRWGELVFERTKFNIDDRSSAWDGTLNGMRLPSENYVYLTEMVCEGGKSFQFKGTLTLIR